MTKKKAVEPVVRGRPPHAPTDVTRNQVKYYCGMGLTQEQMATLMGITRETLRKHYREELDSGMAEMNLRVSENLYNIATNPDHKGTVQASMFWAKTRMGWRDTNRTEVTGPDGRPIQADIEIRDTIDSRLLTQEQRDALKEILIVATSSNASPQTNNGAIGVESDEDGDDEAADED